MTPFIDNFKGSMKMMLANVVPGRDEEERHCKAFTFFMAHV